MGLQNCPQLPIVQVRQVQEIRKGISTSLLPGDTMIAPIPVSVYRKVTLVSRGVVECMDRTLCDSCPRLTSLGGNIAALYQIDTSGGEPKYDLENPLGAFCQTELGQFVPVPIKSKH